MKNMTKRLLKVAAVLLIFLMSASFITLDSSPSLRIAVSSNVNGQLEETDSAVGFARIYGALVADSPDVALDFGNFFSGSPLSDISNGEAAALAASQAGYTAMALGVRDLAYGGDRLRELEKTVGSPLLCANAKYASAPLFAQSYVLLDVKGLTVGITAVIGKDVLELAAGNLDGYEFADAKTEAQKQAIALRKQGSDVVIILADTHDSTLLGQLSGYADLVLAPLSKSAAKNVLAAKNTADCSVASISAPIDGKSIKIDDAASELSAVGFDTIASLTVASAVKQIAKSSEALFAKNAGTLTTDLEARAGMGSIVSDAYRYQVNADFAFESVSALAHSLPKGDVSYGDVAGALPKSGYIVIGKLTGLEVLDVLEQSTQSGIADIGGSVSGEKAGLFVSGLTYTYDSTLPMGERVFDVKVAGEPLVLKKEYTVAVSSYLYGLDAYPTLHNMPTVKQGESCYKALCRYIENGWLTSAADMSRIRAGRQAPVSVSDIASGTPSALGGGISSLPATLASTVVIEDSGASGSDSIVIDDGSQPAANESESDGIVIDDSSESAGEITITDSPAEAEAGETVINEPGYDSEGNYIVTEEESGGEVEIAVQSPETGVEMLALYLTMGMMASIFLAGVFLVLHHRDLISQP